MWTCADEAPGESPALHKVPAGRSCRRADPRGGGICGPRAPPRAAGRGQHAATAALKVVVPQRRAGVGVVPVELGDLGTEVAVLSALTDPLASWAGVPRLMQLLAAGMAYSGFREKPQGRGARHFSTGCPGPTPDLSARVFYSPLQSALMSSSPEARRSPLTLELSASTPEGTWTKPLPALCRPGQPPPNHLPGSAARSGITRWHGSAAPILKKQTLLPFAASKAGQGDWPSPPAPPLHSQGRPQVPTKPSSSFGDPRSRSGGEKVKASVNSAPL